MIVGLGIDVVEVDRIQRSLKRFKGRFKERIYTAHEIAECQDRRRPSLAYAARWAAKEALMKAIGTGWRQGVAFADIEVLHHRTGAPYVQCTGRVAEILNGMGNPTIHLSMSDTRKTAVAVVVLERAHPHD